MSKLAAGVLYVGAFLLPLAYFPDTYDRFVLPKLLLATLLAVTLLALHLLGWAIRGRIEIRRTPLDGPIIAVLAAASLAAIVSINRNVAVFGMYLRYEGLLTLLLYAGLYWLTVQTITSVAGARALMRALLASACAVSVFGILQWIAASLTVGPALSPDFGFLGLARAYATLGNPTLLGAFLVLTLPLALFEYLEGASLAARLLALNATLVIALALGLTFVRSAWLAALLGVVIVLAVFARRRPRAVLLFVGLGALAGVLTVVGVLLSGTGGLPLGSTFLQRLLSIGSSQGSVSSRLHVWADSVPLIMSRPLAGYGLDTFGIVFQRFATGVWAGGFVIDKAHAETVQIAATEGALGLAAYVWLLVSIGRAFWRGRAAPLGIAAFAGLVGYQAWVQVNFSWLPVAAIFWIVLGAAVVAWTPAMPTSSVEVRWLLPRLAISIIAVIVLIAASLRAVVQSHDADAHFLAALGAEARGDLPTARAEVDLARELADTQGRYAFEAGRLALIADASGHVDWPTAREDNLAATRLGTYYSVAYYNLALADQGLGRRQEAIAAARSAVEMDPSSASNRALLSSLDRP